MFRQALVCRVRETSAVRSAVAGVEAAVRDAGRDCSLVREELQSVCASVHAVRAQVDAQAAAAQEAGEAAAHQRTHDALALEVRLFWVCVASWCGHGN